LFDFCLKSSEEARKTRTHKIQISRRKEIMKTRAEINEIEKNTEINDINC
jgi:hypothetical protein